MRFASYLSIEAFFQKLRLKKKIKGKEFHHSFAHVNDVFCIIYVNPKNQLT